MREFLKKPPVKNVILAVLTISISILVGSLGNWDTSQPNYNSKLIGLIIISIVYLCVLGIYTTCEVNDRRENGIFRKNIYTFENIMTNIIAVCQKSASAITKCIHQINDTQTVDLSSWSFNTACMELCTCVYNALCDIEAPRVRESKKYEVVYVKLCEESDLRNMVMAIGFANQGLHPPTIINQERTFAEIPDASQYHDLDLFTKNRADIDIIFGIEPVDSVFAYDTKEKRSANRTKYGLFIGIPVFCDSKKMIGLLEVTCPNPYQLGQNIEEISEIAAKYLVPYANMFLLLHKMEKALLAGTSNSKIGGVSQ